MFISSPRTYPFWRLDASDHKQWQLPFYQFIHKLFTSIGSLAIYWRLVAYGHKHWQLRRSETVTNSLSRTEFAYVYCSDTLQHSIFTSYSLLWYIAALYFHFLFPCWHQIDNLLQLSTRSPGNRIYSLMFPRKILPGPTST